MYRPLRFWQRLLSALCGIAVIVLIWEALLQIGAVPRLLLPHPVQVFKSLLVLLSTRVFWRDILSTVWTWLTGVFLGALLGATSGMLLGLNRYVWAAIEPWIEFVRTLPSVVLVPLISLFLGVGASSRLVCSTVVVAVLMVSTSGTALRSAAHAHQRLARAWRASRIQTIAYFLLPAAISHMTVALKAAIPIALIVTVAADMLIATEAGIGKVIMDSLAVFNTSTMYAAIIVVGVLGYLAALLGTWIERVAIHWSGS